VIVQGRTPPRRPAAQPRFIDIGGGRFLYASDTKHGQLAHLALRHRRLGRCEDEILLPPPKTPACTTCPTTPRTRSGESCGAMACELLAGIQYQELAVTSTSVHYHRTLLLPALKAPGFPGSRGRSTEQSLAVPISPSGAGRIASRPSNHPGSY